MAQSVCRKWMPHTNSVIEENLMKRLFRKQHLRASNSRKSLPLLNLKEQQVEACKYWSCSRGCQAAAEGKWVLSHKEETGVINAPPLPSGLLLLPPFGQTQLESQKQGSSWMRFAEVNHLGHRIRCKIARRSSGRANRQPEVRKSSQPRLRVERGGEFLPLPLPHAFPVSLPLP